PFTSPDSTVSPGNGHLQGPTSDLVVTSQSAVVGGAFSLGPLVSNIEMVPLSEELIPGFKRLNALLLPIAYPQSFYAETMTEPHHSITLMALWHHAPSNTESSTTTMEKPRLIGAIRCRILPSANLYISTIGVLSPYRSYGIAIHLLSKIIAKASREHGVKCVTAHVWEANEEGLEWYKKRGFEIIGKEDGYYRKLKPSGAVQVRKWIRVGDLLGN
ncbi:acyl-CoA N-acyltransferase, partial [Lophiostoma macrostomum CBS 122681]